MHNTIAYVEAEGEWLHDAMVKGGLTAVITNDPILYNVLLNDPATAVKSYLIPSKQDLGRIIKQIVIRTLPLESKSSSSSYSTLGLKLKA